LHEHRDRRFDVEQVRGLYIETLCQGYYGSTVKPPIGIGTDRTLEQRIAAPCLPIDNRGNDEVPLRRDCEGRDIATIEGLLIYAADVIGQGRQCEINRLEGTD